ncbi:MAG TPA: transketolase C-terminal domain-containing protein, partial [Nitriliruptorales bacterium]
GEDGPTHQPIEHLASLRAIPDLDVWRPADGDEVVAAWASAIEARRHPSLIALTRQGVPALGAKPEGGPSRGGYVLRDTQGSPDVILIGTGSEVQHCVGAAGTLAGEGVAARVVSLPCWERFLAQDDDYRESVLPSDVTARVAIEAAASLGWERFTGTRGAIIGLDRFGGSAKGEDLMRAFGFTADNVARTARDLLA